MLFWLLTEQTEGDGFGLIQFGNKNQGWRVKRVAERVRICGGQRRGRLRIAVSNEIGATVTNHVVNHGFRQVCNQVCGVQLNQCYNFSHITGEMCIVQLYWTTHYRTTQYVHSLICANVVKNIDYIVLYKIQSFLPQKKCKDDQSCTLYPSRETVNA